MARLTLGENVDRPTKVGKVPPGFRDACTVRVKDAKFKISSSENPMIMLECEILEPTEVKGVDGETYDLTGLTLTYFLMLTKDGSGATLSLMETLGLDPSIDDENPSPEELEQFKNVCFQAILFSVEEAETKRDPDNPSKFVPIKDKDGKEIKKTKMVANAKDILSRVEDPGGF
jgi:hypothetical protein